jgi:hypothetical protein
MLDDMAMRTMGRTLHDYIRHIRAFAAFLERSPDTAAASSFSSARTVPVSPRSTAR